MAQDIRKMMKDLDQGSKLSTGHEARFANKLEREFPLDSSEAKTDSRNAFFWLKIAAMAIVFFGLGYFGIQQLSDDGSNGMAETSVEDDSENKTELAQISLGDISPDLKKVENFYLAGIATQLASLEDDSENKELIDGYMQRLNELDDEYKALNKELNEVGPTEATITAMIDNLKLRLELLFKLKNKLKELKNLENEQFINSEA